MPRFNFPVNPDDGLLVVDVMPTFMPGGGLPVTGGDLIVPAVRELCGMFPASRRFASREEHDGHISLVSSYLHLKPYTLLKADDVIGWQDRGLLSDKAKFTVRQLQAYLQQVGQLMVFPDHSPAGSPESQLHPGLAGIDFREVLLKGTNPTRESFSAICDCLGNPSGLADRIREAGVRHLYVCGLAYDYCVGSTALDAAIEGFQVTVVMEATRSVDKDSELEMTKKLIQAGVRLMMAGKDPDRATTP